MYDEHTCGADIPTIVMINDFFNTVKGGGRINGRDNKASADNYRNMLVDYLAAASKNILEDYNTPSEQLNERERESTQTGGPNIEKNNSDGQDHCSHSIREDQAAEANLDNTHMSAIGGKTMEADYNASDEDANGGAVDEGDDDANSVSSTKSYYRDLCMRLTFALEKMNAMELQTRIENTRLKEEIAQLRRWREHTYL